MRCSANFPESFQRALEILGKRWTGLILFVLSEGPLRFSELAERIQVIGDRILSDRLVAAMMTRSTMSLTRVFSWPRGSV